MHSDALIGKKKRLAAWLNASTEPDPDRDPFSGDSYRVREAMFKLGLTLRAWQLYSLRGDSVLTALGHPWVDDANPQVSLGNTVTFLNLIEACEMGRFILPPRALVASIRKWELPDGRLDAISTGLLRATWEACSAAEYVSPNNKAAMAHFIKGEMLPVVRWFFTSRMHVGNRPYHWQDQEFVPGWFRIGWLSLSSAYSNWQGRERLKRETASPAPAQWGPLINSIDIDTYRFKAVASEEALHLEGKRMSHCVGDYAPQCQAGLLRVFSIRELETDERVATLSLKESSPGTWSIDELYGRQNYRVREPVQHAAQLFLEAIQTTTSQPHVETAYPDLLLAEH